MKNQQVFIDGVGPIALRDVDYVTSGGEGDIYIKDAFAYKLYQDPAKARTLGMDRKMDRLKSIQSPFLVTPKDLLLDKNRQLVGYRMPRVRGITLMEMFSNAWWDQNGFSMQKAVPLAQKMKSAIEAVHQQQGLVVDGNEMNWMVEGDQPKLMDCDSWQIDNFPATAIMPSIRDWNASSFSRESDWFSWGVVAFQLFTGIHPYKGNHPDFKRGDLEGRMRANASVFDSKVRTPASVRPFQDIPEGLRRWMEAVFQKGDRSMPPADWSQVQAKVGISRKKTPVSGTVRQEFWWEAPGTLVALFDAGLAIFLDGSRARLFDLLGKKIYDLASSGQNWKDQKVAVTRQGSDILEMQVDENTVTVRNVQTGKVLPGIPSRANGVWNCQNRLYLLNPDIPQGMQELSWVPCNEGWRAGVRSAWPVRIRSAQFFRNALVTTELGLPFLMIPTPTSHLPIPMPELRGMKILQACGGDPSLASLVVWNPKLASMQWLVMRREGAEMKIHSRRDVDLMPLMTNLPNGMLVVVPEDNELWMGSPQAPDGKTVINTGLDLQAGQLLGTDQGLMLIENGKIQRLRMQ